MPVTVVVGGQYGSEGKGKIAHFLAREMEASVAIRCGGPNSGHTVIDPKGNPIIFQQLPTASILPDVICVLCAGTYIDLDILKKEIQISKLNPERLFIDPNAVIITPEIRKVEQNFGLIKSIGSTGSGTGEAVLRRIKRKHDILFSRDITSLNQYVKDTKSYLRKQLSRNERIIIEGTQGYGLSLLHSRYYPFVTSRDTTAAGFLSEVGLSPFDVDDIVLTIRAFPIRVGGNSGPLTNEINWDVVTKESGSNQFITELTSVSKIRRRVAKFDYQIVEQAILVNKPNRIILNHIDYVDIETRTGNITTKALSFIEEVVKRIRYPIAYWGSGPSCEDCQHFPVFKKYFLTNNSGN
jgi:adenylosuccinate synthase